MTKKKNRINFFAKVVLAAVTFYALYTLIDLQDRINTHRADAAWLENRLEEANARNNALRAAIDSELTDEVIAEHARNKLDFVMPGEQVFIDVSK